MNNLVNANKLIVGEFVNGIGNAFHNLLSQRIERHSVGPVRLLDQFQLTASQLLPSTSKLMSRTGKDETEKRNVATSESKVDSTVSYPNGEKAINYEAEGEKLRQNIVSKVGHLQTVLTTAIEVSKDRRDLISRRILEQTNFRLEQAKERADRILSEVRRRRLTRSAKPTNLFVSLSFHCQPQNSQMVVRALHTINDGINSIHYFLHSLLDRINTNINYKLPDQDHKIEEEKADASKQSAITDEPKNSETSQNKEKAPEESKQ